MAQNIVAQHINKKKNAGVALKLSAKSFARRAPGKPPLTLLQDTDEAQTCVATVVSPRVCRHTVVVRRSRLKQYKTQDIETVRRKKGPIGKLSKTLSRAFVKPKTPILVIDDRVKDQYWDDEAGEFTDRPFYVAMLTCVLCCV